VLLLIAEVDDEDEDDDEEAEDGYDDIVDRDRAFMHEEGPSARDIEDRIRRKEMWKYVLYSYGYYCINFVTGVVGAA
jgi:hypothetical protein